MDKRIIEIQMAWAEKRFSGLVDQATAKFQARLEVFEYLVTIGAMEAAMEWRWKLAVGF